MKIDDVIDMCNIKMMLEELKELREFKATYQKDYSYATFMYNKAIDDFAEKICTYGTYDDYGNVVDILEIAEKLKKHYNEVMRSKCEVGEEYD